MVAVVLSLTWLTHPAGASNLSNDRAKAATLLNQINRINGEVDGLGQTYDAALIKLHQYHQPDHEHEGRRSMTIETNVPRATSQLRADVIFAYVTNGAVEGNNPALLEERLQGRCDQRLLPARRGQHQRDHRQPEDRPDQVDRGSESP